MQLQALANLNIVTLVDSFISLTAAFALGSLIGFVGFYTVLLCVEMFLMVKFARLGPSSLGLGRYHFERGAPAAAPAEHVRVASLQPQHAVPLPGLFDQAGVDGLLPQQMPRPAMEEVPEARADRIRLELEPLVHDADDLARLGEPRQHVLEVVALLDAERVLELHHDVGLRGAGRPDEEQRQIGRASCRERV